MDKTRRIKQLEADKSAAQRCEREAQMELKRNLTKIANSIAFYLEGGETVGEVIHSIDELMLDARKNERTINDAGWIIRKYEDTIDALNEA